MVNIAVQTKLEIEH